MTYRWAVIITAAGSAVLCAFAIYFNVMALAKYRTDDFLLATTTTDFTALGTCVEVITNEQLKSGGFHKMDISDSKDMQKKFRNALLASANGIYYTYFTAGITNHAMDRVARVVLGAIVNGGSNTNLPTLNYSIAYEALSQVSENVPAPVPNCDAIYAMSAAGIDAAFMALLDDPDQTNWPISEIPIVDNDEADTGDWPGTVDVAADTPGIVDLDAARKAKLYTYCVKQFRFASSGIPMNAGTFGVPLVGEEPGPNSFFYPNADGYNKTTPYSTKTRLFLGQRFGYSMWAYVPMILASCYLCADAVVFFLAEATLPDVMLDTNAMSASALNAIKDSLVISATGSASRKKRFAIGFTAVAVSLLFWILFIVVPWGFVETKMPRPICETGDPDHVSTIFFLGSKGGWKADWDAGFYELCVVVSQVVVLLFLPFTSTSFFNKCNRAFNSTGGRTAVGAKFDVAQFVRVTQKYRRLMRIFLPSFLLGGVVMILGQAISGARFGMAWAEGVVGITMHTDDTTGVSSKAFNEVLLSEQVYDQSIATIAMTIAIGLVIGAALQRHLIMGAGCFSAVLFFAWLGLVIVFFLPLLIYASVRSIFNLSKANEDCASFPDSGYDFEKGACEARFYTFLIGGGLIVIVVGLMTLFGLFEALPNITAVRNKALARIRQGRGTHEVFNPTLGTVAPYRPVSVEDHAPLLAHNQSAGYRSPDEGFFNFKSTLSTEGTNHTDNLLYAPRVSFSLPVAGQPLQYVQTARGKRVSPS